MYIPSEQLPDNLDSIFWGFRIFFVLHVIWFAFLLMYVFNYIKGMARVRDYLATHHPETWKELGEPVLWAYQKGYNVKKVRGLLDFIKVDDRISEPEYTNLKGKILTNMGRALKTLYFGLAVFSCILVAMYLYLRQLLSDNPSP